MLRRNWPQVKLVLAFMCLMVGMFGGSQPRSADFQKNMRQLKLDQENEAFNLQVRRKFPLLISRKSKRHLIFEKNSISSQPKNLSPDLTLSPEQNNISIERKTSNFFKLKNKESEFKKKRLAGPMMIHKHMQRFMLRPSTNKVIFKNSEEGEVPLVDSTLKKINDFDSQSNLDSLIGVLEPGPKYSEHSNPDLKNTAFNLETFLPSKDILSSKPGSEGSSSTLRYTEFDSENTQKLFGKEQSPIRELITTQKTNAEIPNHMLPGMPDKSQATAIKNTDRVQPAIIPSIQRTSSWLWKNNYPLSRHIYPKNCFF